MKSKNASNIQLQATALHGQAKLPLVCTYDGP